MAQRYPEPYLTGRAADHQSGRFSAAC